MKDVLNVYQLGFPDVEVNVGPQHFFHQHRNVEVVGVVSGEVASFKRVGQVLCHLFEGRTILHIVVGDAVYLGGSLRNMSFRIDAHHLRLFIAVGMNLDITDFDDAILCDIDACRLKIEYNQRLFKVNLHVPNLVVNEERHQQHEQIRVGLLFIRKYQAGP